MPRRPDPHPIVPALPTRPAEFLPYSSAYAEAENLRAILKPGAALAEGTKLDKGSTNAEL